MVRAAKADREIRTGDRELKAIHTIQKVLGALDPQAAGRVLTFCIDRARQDFESGIKAQVGQAAKRLTKEAVPAVVEPADSVVPVPATPADRTLIEQANERARAEQPVGV